jgi:hypothetical protein
MLQSEIRMVLALRASHTEMAHNKQPSFSYQTWGSVEEAKEAKMITKKKEEEECAERGDL